MENRRTKWTYIPNEDKLFAIVNGRPCGGFIGQNAHIQFMALLETGADITIGGNIMSFTKKQKIQKLRAIWIRLGCDQYREDILAKYDVTSTADLTEPQLDTLIATYSQDVRKTQDVPKELRDARSVAIKLFMKLGLYNNDNDWTRANAYMMDSRVAGKLLFQMDLEEVRALHKKLRSIIEKEEKKRMEVRRLMNRN